MGTLDTIGANLTLTSTRTLYWDLATTTTVTGTPMVAILGSYEEPTAATVWTPASWEGSETVEGDTHTRRLSVLVAGPNGPVNGSPIVVPAAGEYSTWVRVDTATERIEVAGQLLVVG